MQWLKEWIWQYKVDLGMTCSFLLQLCKLLLHLSDKDIFWLKHISSLVKDNIVISTSILHYSSRIRSWKTLRIVYAKISQCHCKYTCLNFWIEIIQNEVLVWQHRKTIRIHTFNPLFTYENICQYPKLLRC